MERDGCEHDTERVFDVKNGLSVASRRPGLDRQVGDMRTRRRAAALLPLLVLLGACTQAGPPNGSAGPSGTPPSTATAGLPSGAPATAGPTPTPVPTQAPRHCPTASPMSPTAYAAADPGCFAGRDVVILGWLDFPPAMGWEGPAIVPGWLAYPVAGLSAVWSERPSLPDHLCRTVDCAWFFIHLAPGSSVRVPAKPAWLVVTGHREDALAETCHYDLSAWPTSDPAPNDADARGQCRDSFVVTAIQPGLPPSP
jgi:hypothetical protein